MKALHHNTEESSHPSVINNQINNQNKHKVVFHAGKILVGGRKFVREGLIQS